MKYTISILNDIVILEIHGHWINDPEEYKIHQEVKKHLQQGIEAGARHVIVDLEHCKFVASGGIGGLGAIKASTAARNGKVLLCGVNDRVRRSLVVSGMWHLFDSYATRGEALHALSQAPSSS